MHYCTLTIRYDMPASNWPKLLEVYESMAGWQGLEACDIPIWLPDGPNGGQITASVEPSVLLMEGNVSEQIWQQWLAEFMLRATTALGYPVKDCEQ